MSAVVCGFNELDPEWPKAGMILSNSQQYGMVVNKIERFSESYGSEFIRKYVSIAGMFQLIQERGAGFPGTWRPSLEFLLRKTLFGVEDACAKLGEIASELNTGYERHQVSWLLRHQCR
jgi:hypothetical protein